MLDYLVSSAMSNLWSNPSIDNQLILNLSRISPPGGAYSKYRVMLTDYTLPTNDRYHVFVLGNIFPLTLNLFDNFSITKPNEWVSFSTAITNTKVLVDIYTNYGVQLPKFECFYTFDTNYDLIIVVKDNSKLPINYGTDKIFLRVFTNSYFKTAIGSTEIGLVTYGLNIKTPADQILIQSNYNSLNVLPGNLKLFINGYYTNVLDTTIGNIVELLYDSSAYKYVDFPINKGMSFTSTLDKKKKYILHHLKDTINQIEFYDDVDFYVNYTDPVTGLIKGLYYNKNVLDSVRMLTHRDYSIVVDYVNNYIAQLQATMVNTISLNNITIRAIYKKCADSKSVYYENNRILDLYKLPDNLIVNNLIGNGLPIWFADNLESSQSSMFYGKQFSTIKLNDVINVLGYNSASKILGDTPTYPINVGNVKQCSVPFALQSNCLVYEYAAVTGKMLGYSYINNQFLYNTKFNGDLVEMVYGTNVNTLKFTTNSSKDLTGWLNNTLNLNQVNGYRVYMCTVNAVGFPDLKWRDITNSNEYHLSTDGLNTLISNNLSLDQFFMVRFDNTIVTNDLTFGTASNINLVSEGNIKFTLSEQSDMMTKGTLITNSVMSVPMGSLDIYLNGRALIANLDYVVKFPEVVITNTSFLNNVNPNIVHYRYSGFCNPDLTMEPIDDSGFIINGTLSANNKYDIRDNKVLKVIVNGGVFNRDLLFFAENSAVGNTLLNGLPYQIKDIVVPMRVSEGIDTYSYREQSKIIDKQISTYMTNMLPQVEILPLPTITNKWIIYSPFLTSIVTAMKTGVLTDVILANIVTDNDVLLLAKPYEKWLPFDPTQIVNNINTNYVVVQATNQMNGITLNLFQYRFLLSVNRLYCNGLVDLSQYVTLI